MQGVRSGVDLGGFRRAEPPQGSPEGFAPPPSVEATETKIFPYICIYDGQKQFILRFIHRDEDLRRHMIPPHKVMGVAITMLPFKEIWIHTMCCLEERAPPLLGFVVLVACSRHGPMQPQSRAPEVHPWRPHWKEHCHRETSMPRRDHRDGQAQPGIAILANPPHSRSGCSSCPACLPSLVCFVASHPGSNQCGYTPGFG